MKTLCTGAAFVLLCAAFAGIFTSMMLTIIDETLSCDDTRAALAEYRIQHILTLAELERLEENARSTIWDIPNERIDTPAPLR